MTLLTISEDEYTAYKWFIEGGGYGGKLNRASGKIIKLCPIAFAFVTKPDPIPSGYVYGDLCSKERKAEGCFKAGISHIMNILVLEYDDDKKIFDLVNEIQVETRNKNNYQGVIDDVKKYPLGFPTGDFWTSNTPRTVDRLKLVYLIVRTTVNLTGVS